MTYAQIDLLNHFLGKWEGTLYISQEGKKIDSAEATFEIHQFNDSILTWKTTYNSPKYQNIVKDYQLIYTKNNHFELYENDTISLDSFWNEGALYSNFTYNKTIISVIYDFTDKNKIVHTMLIGQATKVNELILSYLTSTHQKVIYRKVE